MNNRRHFIRVEANLENLAVIRGFVRLNAISLGTGRDQVSDIVVSVDEAATNVMMHGYQYTAGVIEIELERDGNYLVIYMRDNAPNFNPLDAPEPDLTLPIEERPLGGLGVHLIKQAMDHVEYRVLANGGNELMMKKHI